MDKVKALLYPTKDKIVWSVVAFVVSMLAIPVIGFATMVTGVAGYISFVAMWILGAGFFLGLKVGSPFLLQIVYAYVIVVIVTFLMDRKRKG